MLDIYAFVPEYMELYRLGRISTPEDTFIKIYSWLKLIDFEYFYFFSLNKVWVNKWKEFRFTECNLLIYKSEVF
jgi:hypothetical protein